MSVSISITCYRLEDPPRASVLQIAGGERFITLAVDAYTNLTLDGFDAEAIAHARQLAAVLTIAADQVEAAVCDCIASGHLDKPKQHGADPHAKNCRVYTGRAPIPVAAPPPAPCPDLTAAELVPDLMDSVF